MKNPESVTFIVTMWHGESMRLTLTGDEARNCLVDQKSASQACGAVHVFVDDFYGSFVVKAVDIEGYERDTNGTKHE